VLTATVRARIETDLGFRVAGRIVQRLKDVGDRVKAGEPIARLDPSDYALGLEAARDQLRAATVDAEQAASDEARLRRLLADGSVGTADHERQKARADATAARVDEARRHLELARNRMAYATLVAPYTGVVTALRMEVGQVVGEGQSVASLAREGEREIVADVPEALVARVRQMRATATPWHSDDTPIELRLREVSPMASSITGTFRVRYAIAQNIHALPHALPLGATARLQLSGSGESGAALPASALVKANGDVDVWIVDGRAGGLHFKPVQVQQFEADAVRVGGLDNGSRVVTVGAQKLDAAMKVTAIERRDDGYSSDVVGMEGGR
jgi:RND family efflux transporter MFP subunit